MADSNINRTIAGEIVATYVWGKRYSRVAYRRWNAQFGIGKYYGISRIRKSFFTSWTGHGEITFPYHVADRWSFWVIY